MTMKHIRLVTLAIILIDIVVTILAFMIPAPPHVTDASIFHLQFGFITLFSWLYFGAALLFILGIKGFKAGVSKAYQTIAIGMVILGLTQLQYPFIDLFNWWSLPWFTYGGTWGVSALGSLLFLLGVRQFAHVTGIKTSLLSPGIATLLTIIITVPIALLPHVPPITPTPEIFYDLSQGFIIAGAIYTLFAALTALTIKRQAGSTYTRSFAWLSIALLANMFSSVQAGLFTIIGYTNWYVSLRLIIVPFIATGILLMTAGYSFNKITKR